MKTDFGECKERFLGNATNIALYGVGGLPLLDFHGCQKLCGKGVDYYPWPRSSSTITTWILPILGVILQAPFESNAFWRTLFAIARWVGSPIASLMHILWNITASGKCAMMVDMSIPLDVEAPPRQSDFGNIRDSFYILTVMNQYMLHESIRSKKETILLLKLALFCEDAIIRKPTGQDSLKSARQQLAQKIREHRRRGATPVFIANAWFLFSMALSIQQAFGYLGDNGTAHDLALGCLMAWLPVLILCGIVDRNPVATEVIRRKINKFIGSVKETLNDEILSEQFMRTFRREGVGSLGSITVERLSNTLSPDGDEYFTSFAGQARLRWFRGCAHQILSTVENGFIAQHGRAWLLMKGARSNIILSTEGDSALLNAYKECWQAVKAILIVGSAYLGAFIISYYTPMIGLGCRSGGYTIYGVVCVGLFLLELLTWWFTLSENSQRRYNRQQSNSYVISSDNFGEAPATRMSFPSKNVSRSSTIVVEETGAAGIDSQKCRQKTIRRRADRFFFSPAEVINSAWLLYIIMAQTFGAYNNCACWTSMIGKMNGDMSFEQVAGKDDPHTRFYWILGTTVSCASMSLSMAYVIKEWCLQSHLCTEKYESAWNGVRSTRRWRTFTFPATYTRHLAEQVVFDSVRAVSRLVRHPQRPRRALHWAPTVKRDPASTRREFHRTQNIETTSVFVDEKHIKLPTASHIT